MGLSRGFALFLSLVSVASAGTIPMNREALLVPSREEWHDIRRVPITLGVMSRCPDALTCEAVFDDVLRRVGYEKVDLALTFIARLVCKGPLHPHISFHIQGSFFFPC